MIRRFISTAFAAAFFLASPCLAQRGWTLYVDSSARPGGDGLSWGTAFTSLQEGLAVAEDGDQIWLAEGVYTPDQSTHYAEGDRNASFHLIEGVSIYGGFHGHEVGVEHREGTAKRTILSGDLERNDRKQEYGDNSLHVVRARGVGSSTLLDGLTIRSGFASGSGSEGTGGGLYATAGASPTLRSVCFTQNRAAIDGAAAICLGAGTPEFQGCQFLKNAAEQDAGAIYLALSSTARFIDCRFEKNTAGRYGGAVNLSLSAAPEFERCRFVRNTSVVHGGAFYSDHCSSRLRDCRFVENSTDGDGGAYFGTGSPVMEHCIFSRNQAQFDGGAVFVFSLASQAEFDSCRFLGNLARRDGGAMFSSGAVLLRSCRLSKNDAERDGGGLNVSGTGQETSILSCRFDGNVAKLRGGAIFQAGTGISSIEGTRFLRNSAERGGGLYHGETELHIAGCELQENTASQKGGGVFLINSVAGAEIRETLFQQNRTGIVGGALYVTNNSSPLVEDCTFLGNHSDIHAGAVYNTTSESSGGVNHSRFLSCDFVGNTAYQDGGAILNATSANGGDCSPLILDCDFYANRADKHGGAMFNIAFQGTSFPALYNCTLLQNEAGQNGGGFYNSTTGHPGSQSRPELLNCVLNGNQAGVLGGAFFNTSATSDLGDSNAVLTNCTVTFNSAGVNGGGLYNVQFGTGISNPVVTNCILWGNADAGAEDSSSQLHVASGLPVVRQSNIQYGLGGNGNIAVDPQFRDPLGRDLIPGTRDDDLRLVRRSPCVDRGLESALPSDRFDLDLDQLSDEPLPIDHAGCVRSVVRSRTPVSGPVDLGAHEQQRCKKENTGELARLMKRLQRRLAP